MSQEAQAGERRSTSPLRMPCPEPVHGFLKRRLTRHGNARSGKRLLDQGRVAPMRATAPAVPFRASTRGEKSCPFAVSAENDEDAAALSCEALNGSGHSAHVGALRVVDEGNAVTIEHALDSMRLAPVRGKRGERRSDGQACSLDEGERGKCVHRVVAAGNEKRLFRAEERGLRRAPHQAWKATAGRQPLWRGRIRPP